MIKNCNRDLNDGTLDAQELNVSVSILSVGDQKSSPCCSPENLHYIPTLSDTSSCFTAVRVAATALLPMDTPDTGVRLNDQKRRTYRETWRRDVPWHRASEQRLNEQPSFRLARLGSDCVYCDNQRVPFCWCHASPMPKRFLIAPEMLTISVLNRQTENK